MRVGFLTPLRVLVAGTVIAGAVAVVVHDFHVSTRTITADFAQTPGLYVGNHVDVLGIPVGRITGIRPEPRGVTVTMDVDTSVKIPAHADAVLMAPQVVNDRFVQLDPAYSGGPTMAAGAYIPESRTAEPLSVDQILGSLDSLFNALGPTAQAHKGILDSLIKELDAQLGGQGQNLHDAIGAASEAFSDLAADGPGVSATLTKLSTLIGSLAADAGNYESFTNDLATVAAELNGDKGTLASALATLQESLGQITTFVKANSANFGASLDNLDKAASGLAGEQSQLSKALEITPLALQNLGQAVHQTSNGPAIMGRFDSTKSTRAFVDLLCGSIPRRAVAIGEYQGTAPVIDPVCAFGAATAEFNQPEGTPPGPVLTIPALMKAEAEQ